MVEILLDPNIAYLTLVLAFLTVLMAILTPGTAVLEITAVLLMIVAGWQVYNLPVNWWALIVLIGALILFILAVRRLNTIFLGLTIAALIVGSVFLFQGEVWYDPAVNPVLAIIVSTLVGGFLWVATTKVLEAERATPTHDLVVLIGQIGEAKTNIHAEGSVQVAGELWSAQSEQKILQGSRIRVIDRDGFLLTVEAVDENQPES